MNYPAAALQDLLAGRLHQHGWQLDGFTDPEWQQYADLLAAAFLVAVRRRFAPGPAPDRVPLIRLVASARERYDPSGTTIDPLLAESLLLAALVSADPGSNRPPEQPCASRNAEEDAGAVVMAQTVLLLALLEDEGLFLSECAGLVAAAEAIVPEQRDLRER